MTVRDVSFGTYVDTNGSPGPISRLSLDILPLDLVVQWRRCGQTADYVAAFLAYHFGDFGRAMNILSTVVNELVENSVKFSSNKRHLLRLGALFYGDTMILETTNSISEEQVITFSSFIKRLLDGNLDDIFIQQVEHSAEYDVVLTGLGLLSLKRDYASGMGVRIRTESSSSLHEVTVQLQLDIDSFEDD